MAQLQIRRIEAHDAQQVHELIKQLGYQRPFDEVKTWIESLSDYQNVQTAFVACVDNEIIGWIEVSIVRHLQSAPFALIGGLVVKDGFRGEGVGLRLCEQVEGWSWNHGVSILRVTSRSTRSDAHRFYVRNGYLPTKISHVFEKSHPGK